MNRLLLVALVSWVGLLPAQTEGPAYQDLPEEDEDLIPSTDYSFNPIQAAEEFRVGEFYWKRGSYKAAAGRYEEATKWDPSHANAFFKLGEAQLRLAEAAGPEAEKEAHQAAAQAAYESYIELEPKGGRADRVRRRLAQLEHP